MKCARRWPCTAATLLVGIGLAAAAFLAGATAEAEVVNRVVATVDGDPVTLFELETFAEQVRRRPGASTATDDRRALLDELVLERILKKQVESQGVAASEQQIDAYINSIRERNDLTEAGLKQVLAEQGLTWEQYRAQVRTDIERAALINKEIRDKVNVSPEEIERYYTAHLADYGTQERIRARLITLLVAPEASAEQRASVRAEIERIRALADDGKDFAKLAREHSQGPSASEGGDLGELARGQMESAFEQAAFGLKPGQISQVIETADGYHILKVEKREGESHQPLSEVAGSIREKLYRDSLEERYDRWLKQDLRSRHHVEILL